MRNDATLSALCRELQSNCGDMLAAAQRVGVSLIFVEQWRKDDKVVDERLTEAERVGTQGLVSAAIHRAVRGVEKGVYFKGARVDTEIVYSDSLLTTLLKAKVPEFAKDKEGSSPVNVQVNVANLMPRANTYEEWLAMKESTTARPALPAETKQIEHIEAEFVEVQPQSVLAGIDL